ncbi:hypothetical protein TEA_005719 [Camellia sinensis var. sinensis]|uniref:Trafficking protein particle complex subunit n=1 Tax=Camellia sinensis var. sinensis TaxID=542762 RepID=A0A4S4D650_CAMSN|nr:hypothetical protein TEA_005719 [Camellia sinensis var. sinensis]
MDPLQDLSHFGALSDPANKSDRGFGLFHYVSLSAFAFLFSELVQYNQTQVDNITELERRLEDAGYAVGARVLELLCHREKVWNSFVRYYNLFSELQLSDWYIFLNYNYLERDTIVGHFVFRTQHSMEGVVWKGSAFFFSSAAFHGVADSLEKGTEHEDEYMISEKELLVNRFISIPKDMGTFNCGAFVAGIVRGVLDGAGFPAVVTAHFVPVEGQQRPRTTILIKFAEEIVDIELEKVVSKHKVNHSHGVRLSIVSKSCSSSVEAPCRRYQHTPLLCGRRVSSLSHGDEHHRSLVELLQSRCSFFPSRLSFHPKGLNIFASAVRSKPFPVDHKHGIYLVLPSKSLSAPLLPLGMHLSLYAERETQQHKKKHRILVA